MEGIEQGQWNFPSHISHYTLMFIWNLLDFRPNRKVPFHLHSYPFFSSFPIPQHTLLSSAGSSPSVSAFHFLSIPTHCALIRGIPWLLCMASLVVSIRLIPKYAFFSVLISQEISGNLILKKEYCLSELVMSENEMIAASHGITIPSFFSVIYLKHEQANAG